MRKSLLLAAVTFALGCSSANTSPEAGSPDVGLDSTGAVDLPLVSDLVVIADAGNDASGDPGRDSVGSEARAPGIARLSPSTPSVNLGTIDMVAGGVSITQFELSVDATVDATRWDASPSTDATTVVDQGSPVTPNEFFEERANSVCFAVSSACLIATSICTAGRVAEYEATCEDALAKSRSFIPSNARSCLARVREIYDQLLQGRVAIEAVDYQSMEAVCANVNRGSGASKGACLADVDCVSGFCEPFVDKCASDIRYASGSAACIAMGGA